MFHHSDTDQFLSEEDLDIGNLDWPERIAVWNGNAWLLQMRRANEQDKDDHSHGVFLSEKQKREL